MCWMPGIASTTGNPHSVALAAARSRQPEPERSCCTGSSSRPDTLAQSDPALSKTSEVLLGGDTVADSTMVVTLEVLPAARGDKAPCS
jgi:hypothetical protein